MILIFFIDEVRFAVSMRTRCGRSRKGTRTTHVVSGIRTKNFSICSAINKDGMILFNVKQGEYNSDNFVTFLESLFHKLSIMKISNGKLIMDNVRFHKTKSVRLLIENSFI